MRLFFYIFLLSLTAVFFIASCQLTGIKTGQIKEDKLLAQVYNESLYASQLASVFESKNLNAKDSLSLLRSSVDEWIQETLLLKDAQKKITNTAEIQKLVEDYKEGLILDYYRKLLIKLQMDTLITESEIKNYYAQYMTDYIANENIYNIHLIEFDRKKKINDAFKKWWKEDRSNEDQNIMEYIQQNATFYLILGSNWKTKQEIQTLLPEAGTSSTDIFDFKPHKIKTTDKRYYVEIGKKINSGAPLPLVTVKHKIKKTILRKRQSNILEYKKKELLKREQNKSNLKIYLN